MSSEFVQRQPKASWMNLLNGDTRAIAYLAAFEFGRFMVDSHPENYEQVKECFRIYMDRLERVTKVAP